MIIGIIQLKEKYVQNKMNVMLFIVDNSYIHIYIQLNSVYHMINAFLLNKMYLLFKVKTNVYNLSNNNAIK